MLKCSWGHFYPGDFRGLSLEAGSKTSLFSESTQPSRGSITSEDMTQEAEPRTLTLCDPPLSLPPLLKSVSKGRMEGTSPMKCFPKSFIHVGCPSHPPKYLSPQNSWDNKRDSCFVFSAAQVLLRIQRAGSEGKVNTLGRDTGYYFKHFIPPPTTYVPSTGAVRHL